MQAGDGDDQLGQATGSGTDVRRRVHFEVPTDGTGNDGQAAVINAELDLADRSLQHVICTLDEDLQSMEQEITGADPLQEAYLMEVKEF